MNFKEWRQAQGMTQDEAAEFFDVTQSMVSAWERGAKRPADVHLRSINDKTAGQVTPNDFILTDA